MLVELETKHYDFRQWIPQSGTSDIKAIINNSTFESIHEVIMKVMI